MGGVRAKGNDLYDEALRLFVVTQHRQIKKGQAKYPEPLNPDSWTELQLIDHALEEAVDQIHYLTALRQKILKGDNLSEIHDERIKQQAETVQCSCKGGCNRQPKDSD